MRMGALHILEKHGKSPLRIAELLILGEITEDLKYVDEIVSPVILETARIRLQALGKLTPEYIKPAE